MVGVAGDAGGQVDGRLVPQLVLAPQLVLQLPDQPALLLQSAIRCLHLSLHVGAVRKAGCDIVRLIWDLEPKIWSEALSME